MKIIRHLTPQGPAHAALQPDGRVHRIEGDLFGDFRVLKDIVKPGKLLAPVAPVNILAIGMNYRKHAEEGGRKVPDRPVLFLKATNTVQNPGDPIEIPLKLASSEVDFECELAVVIGRRCKNVGRDQALDYVLGYTCANDVSARDWQQRWGGGQFSQGKSFDTFCPLGPMLVTRDEIPNPNELQIRTTLNGQVLQDWNTRDMVFDVPALIEFLSGSKTLLPGTVILTGTPHGVGFARRPPVFMQAGDIVSIDIERIGTLTNPVANERLDSYPLFAGK
jgi:2-keto-4-pentenoate hydratase/2-oxohepta-3-ene-1,7-dioic acid hydratase in catechol pathway